jgi:hypothetical protein
MVGAGSAGPSGLFGEVWGSLEWQFDVSVCFAAVAGWASFWPSLKNAYSEPRNIEHRRLNFEVRIGLASAVRNSLFDIRHFPSGCHQAPLRDRRARRVTYAATKTLTTACLPHMMLVLLV